MAFESLSEKLQNVFKNLRGKGRLTEADVKTALKEVKMALLEADVSFKVVKQFVKAVQEKAVGADVMNGLNPGQMVIKIVNEELVFDGFRDDGDCTPPGLGSDRYIDGGSSGSRKDDNDCKARSEVQVQRTQAVAGGLRRISTGGNQTAAGKRREGRCGGIYTRR